MSRRFLFGAVGVALVGGLALAADPKSGPQPGEKMKVFNPLNVTGPSAGESRCLV